VSLQTKGFTWAGSFTHRLAPRHSRAPAREA